MKHIYQYPPRIVTVPIGESSGITQFPIKQLEELLQNGYKIVRVTGQHDGSKHHIYFLEHPVPVVSLRPPQFDDMFNRFEKLIAGYN
jgi:hypothetical protein